MSNENLPKLVNVKGYFVFDDITASANIYEEQTGATPVPLFWWDGFALFPMVRMPDHKYYVDADKTITDPSKQKHVLVFESEENWPTYNGQRIRVAEIPFKVPADAAWDAVKQQNYRVLHYRSNYSMDDPYVNNTYDGFGRFFIEYPGNQETYHNADIFYAVSNALQSYTFFNFDKDKLSFAKAVQAFKPLDQHVDDNGNLYPAEPPYKNEYVDPNKPNSGSRSVKNPSAPADTSKTASASNNAQADTSKSAPADNNAKADTTSKANTSNSDPKAAGGNDGSAAKTDTNAKASTDSKADTSAKASADSKADTDKKGKN